MRLDGLGGDGHVGAVSRRPQADRKPNAARSAGDEKSFALERGHGVVELFGGELGHALLRKAKRWSKPDRRTQSDTYDETQS
jgi:hypothetical protein